MSPQAALGEATPAAAHEYSTCKRPSVSGTLLLVQATCGTQVPTYCGVRLQVQRQPEESKRR